MILQVIEGGKDVPVSKGGSRMVDMDQLGPAEVARFAVIDRVAAQMWAAEHGSDPDAIDWQAYVQRGYAEAESSPGILADVSTRYRMARAAVSALRPPEPDFDEGISVRAYSDVPCSVLEMAAMTQYITRWIDEVLR